MNKSRIKLYSVLVLVLTLAPCPLSLAPCHLPLVASVSAASWDPEETLRDFLADNYPWENMEISNVQAGGSIPDKAPDAIIVEKGPLGKGVFTFVFDDDRRITVRADIRAFEKTVRSKRPFKKGYVLTEEDVYMSETDINKMPRNAVKDSGSIIGKPLRRSILANVPIVEGMVEKSQTVKKGRKVLLLINSRQLNISAAGETKENGYVGMPVRAINLSSKKEVRGVLIDENTVKVEL
ncbi:MAG: flagella basal body P-ring formation protein FlgA [Nitrospiraceae bacterium]|nr:MAG: flagella basal body P-ring formation protein FlgA [Nitrospiraceae bacterium]